MGQRRVVGDLMAMAQGARALGEPIGHILLAGPAGLGKTTIARLLAGELGAGFHEGSATQIETPLQLLDILAALRRGDVLFLDEIHRLNSACQHVLLGALEDGRVEFPVVEDGETHLVHLELEPFTLVGATTQPESLNKPLRSRFRITHGFEFYEVDELREIVERTAARHGQAISPEAAVELARRSRETPREAVRLFLRARQVAAAAKADRIEHEHAVRAAELEGIDANGLRAEEREVLRYLVSVGHPVGIATIADALGQDLKTVRRIYEPFLLRHGYLKRTQRGRVATAKARGLFWGRSEEGKELEGDEASGSQVDEGEGGPGWSHVRAAEAVDSVSHETVRKALKKTGWQSIRWTDG